MSKTREVGPAIVPEPAPPDTPKLFYRRGRRYPRAISWFGFKSFWGHMWHLGASAMATEDIDCRDWMQADPCEEFTRRVAAVLKPTNAPNASVTSLTEALDGDLWIDFIADTGDDFSVSKAVGRMVFARYEVDDPEDRSRRLELPRGHLLIFGGDTAYPVATEVEIHNRVVVPFNQALRNTDDTPRVILGLPGNHDWYAGLDGFGRLFRARRMRLDQQLPATTAEEKVDRFGQLGQFVKWVEAFRVGRHVVKRPALALDGYTPVQRASYFALRLAPTLDVWGIDRQLRAIDFEQRAYFSELHDNTRGIVLCLADPVHAFLEPNPAGVSALESLDVSIEGDGLLVLTGDTHHYCRQVMGKGMHVIAGGGGAFLHPPCIARGGKPAPAAEFPGRTVGLALALQVPWQLAHGRSGFIMHAVIAIALGPVFALQWSTGTRATTASMITAVVLTAMCIFLGGFRHRAAPIAGLSLVTGVVIGFMPREIHDVVWHASPHLGVAFSPMAGAVIAYVLSIYIGVLAMGTYLMLLTIFGLEQHQAFSALAHPGYKHFVRLRVRRDGTKIDAWVLGRVDPLSKDDKVVLVDQFSWKNPKAA